MSVTTMMFLTSIAYILLLAQMDTGHCETYEDFVDRAFREICPYEKFCSRNATKALANSNLSSCCSSCSCDKACTSRGNCCPDYSGSVTTGDDDGTLPMETCLPAAHIIRSDDYTEDESLFRGIPYYHTVASCPTQYPDETIATRCTEPIPEDFISAVRVSDGTGRVYRNRHCAFCHGVTDYKSWTLLIRYKGDMPFGIDDYTKFNVTELLNTGFQIVSIPPKDHRKFMSRCYLPNIVECNQTGYWERFDADLQRACNSYTMEYIYMTPRFTRIYKNPFCYLCNTWSTQAIREYCEVDDDSEKLSSPNDFTLIIDIDRDVTAHKAQQKYPCPNYQIQDPYFSVCKPLYCPIGTHAWYGRCINPYKATTGMAIVFPIAINVTINGDAKSADRHFQIQKGDNADELLEILMKRIGISAKRCKACEATLYQLDDPMFSSPLVLMAQFITTTRCTTSDMFEAVISNIERRTFLASIGNMRVTITTALQYGLTMRSFYDLSVVQNAFTSYWPGFTCMSALMISQPKFYCPNLELTYREYQHVISGNTTGSPATYEDFTVVNYPNVQESNENMYKICIKDYLRLETTSSGTSSVFILDLSVLVMFNGILALL